MKKHIAAVDLHRELILEAQKTIWAHPETGYREVKTSAFLATQFEKLGYTLTRAGDIPGFYTIVDTGRPGPEVLILGELDSLICPSHPDADPETGAVHCCGHSAQCAALLGIAAALREPGVLDGWSGRIRLCAVPAEEFIEVGYRKTLKEQRIIRYLGGKAEFLYRGYFDGVDIAFMVHTIDGGKFRVGKGSVGMVAKQVIYKGVSAHAGAAPWYGCNALYAASLGLNAVNALRETFREDDLIRVHPIITAGGGAVNAIPETAVLESYVRGKTFDAIKQANEKVNRALCGAALSLGAGIDIQDAPGYAPLLNSDDMIALAIEAAQAFPGIPMEVSDNIGTGSTDMGDLSCLMPAVHPYAPGAVGTGHGADYYIEDPELACVTSAKWQLEMLDLLLRDGAVRARQVIQNFTPRFVSKESYFACIDALSCQGDRIAYDTDSATVKL